MGGERFNQLVGFIVGDGFCYKKKSRKNYLVGFIQSSKKANILEYYKNLLSTIFNKKPIVEKAPHGVIKVYIYSKDAYNLFREIKENPAEYLRRLPQEEKMKFFGGFIDAEGMVRRDRIILYNADKDLILEIQELLKAYGVKSTIHFHHGVYELHIWERKSREIVASICKDYSVKLSSLFLPVDLSPKSPAPPEKGCLRS
uniref:rRNA intron-encoded endonuclease n=1 Tax=Pyrobaculum sp. M1T TaxID=278051 RepID=Q6L6Z8_9CREN|nr:rRNA intron-encoded endonuclease [Pyrobaculum sp. M1T]